MKSPWIPASLLVLLAGCSTLGGSTLSAVDELTLAATTGGEESLVSSSDEMSPVSIPASERPDPFRTCDAPATYEGLFSQYDADGDGRLDTAESDDVSAARDDRSDAEAHMAMAQWGMFLTVYDLDGSLSLDESERATLLDDFTVRCESIQAFLLATYDADGDGTLSTAEQDTARAAMEAEMASHPPPDCPEGGHDGPPPGGPSGAHDGPPPEGSVPPPLLDEFDADGSGDLDATELATLRETMRARFRAGGPPFGPPPAE
jgi:hypothetical protein